MQVADASGLRVFVIIAERRSFRAAAHFLGVSPSAVSQTLRLLEERMGVRLFNRTTRSVAMTEAGERLLMRVRPALAVLDDAVTEIASPDDRPSGSLRISAAAEAAPLVIRKVLPRFIAAYPGITVEISAEDRVAESTQDGFDAGIRLRSDVPHDMVSVPFGPQTMRAVVVASPTYMTGRSIPMMPQDLQHHQCIRHRADSGPPESWELEKDGNIMAVDIKGALAIAAPEHRLDAALAGLGMSLLPEPLVLDHIKTGRLVQVLKDWSATLDGFCLYHRDGAEPAALRLFSDALRQTRLDEAGMALS